MQMNVRQAILFVIRYTFICFSSIWSKMQSLSLIAYINAVQDDFSAKTVPIWSQYTVMPVTFLERAEARTSTPGPEEAVLRVVCPNFGHLALTSSFTKYKFLQVKNNFLSFLSLQMVIYYFHSMHTASTKCVNLEWRS